MTRILKKDNDGMLSSIAVAKAQIDNALSIISLIPEKYITSGKRREVINHLTDADTSLDAAKERILRKKP